MHKTAPVVHASVATSSGTATLRDLSVNEVGEIVRYWHESGDEHLDRMGADRALLGSPAETEQRFIRAIRSGDPEQRNIAFAIELDGALAGYSLLNRYSPEINYGHWHILRPELRGRGLSTALYPHRIKMYFDLVAMTRLVHQTRTTNIGINRMLDKYVAVSEVCYVPSPDGVASPGDFNLRYVRREDIRGLFEKAARLRSSF